MIIAGKEDIYLAQASSLRSKMTRTGHLPPPNREPPKNTTRHQPVASGKGEAAPTSRVRVRRGVGAGIRAARSSNP